MHSDTDKLLMYVMFATLLEGINSVQLLKMDVPRHVTIGGFATLTCFYTLESQELLYSIKWYHGNNEFYRFVPKDKPPGQVFGRQGDKVNLKLSTDRQVVLEDVDLSTTGMYSCEASADAPTFSTVSDSRMMVVIDLPTEGPKISGGRSKYRVGDTVRVNCSSRKSSPAAMLEWFVNGRKVSHDFLIEYPTRRFRDGRSSSKLGMEFRVTEQHFQNGAMTLRCVASIEPVYTVSNEQSMLSELMTESALESRGSLSRVSGNNIAVTSKPSPTIISYLVVIIWIATVLVPR